MRIKRFRLAGGLLAIALGITGIVFLSACDPPLNSASDPTHQALNADIGEDAAPPSRQPAKVTLPVSGDVVLSGGWAKGNKSTATAEFFDPTTGKFKKTGSMAVSAGAGVAALLTVGVAETEILVAGGFGGSSKFTKKTVSQQITGLATNNLQLFDPLTGSFGTATTLSMPRLGATATTLVSGKVLIAGGADSTANPTVTAEVFDPATGLTTATANNMSSARMFHTATLLGDGTVLLAGGGSDNVGDLNSSADIYTPATNKFAPTTTSMTIPRAAHAAALLTIGSLAGDVLITGGASGNNSGLFAQSTVEIYDPVAGSFSGIGVMNDSRVFHTATVLQNGQVLLVGGLANFFSTVNGATGSLLSLFGSSLSSAELFDPTALTFTCIGGTSGTGGVFCSAAMKETRSGHTATLLTSGPLAGQVLIAGGFGAKKPNSKSAELKEVELFDLATDSFTKTGSLKTARGLHTAILLP